MPLINEIERVRADRPPGCSLDQLINGKKSIFWNVLCAELDAWLADTWLALEQCKPEEVAYLQGRIRAIREILALPDALTEVLNQYIEEKEHDTERK